MNTMVQKAQDLGIKIVKGDNSNESAPGIHLVNPSDYELNAALERALQQNHSTIFVHELGQLIFVDFKNKVKM